MRAVVWGGGRLEVPAPVYAWVQFETFSWRIDTAVVLAATADAVLVEWTWVGQRQQAWVWRTAVKHRALTPRALESADV